MSLKYAPSTDQNSSEASRNLTEPALIYSIFVSLVPSFHMCKVRQECKLPERDFQLLIYTLYASRKMTGPGTGNLPLLSASYLVTQVIGALGYTYKKYVIC